MLSLFGSEEKSKITVPTGRKTPLPLSKEKPELVSSNCDSSSALVSRRRAEWSTTRSLNACTVPKAANSDTKSVSTQIADR